MELNIASVEIEPKRHTFGHIARRFGEDRPASRYEEGIYDAQETENFHYRPMYEPEFEIYDKNRTKIKMNDWYDLLDPRKFHYMTYVSARSKENSANQQSFDFIDNNGLIYRYSTEMKEEIYKYLAPLRHYEYAANLNNLNIVARGYGTALNAAALFYATDSLGMAQHITKTILTISDNDTSVLDEAKNSWMSCEDWQPLRKLVEETLVIRDPIQILVAQNLVLDGLVIPLLVKDFSANIANKHNDFSLRMMLEFVYNWQEETTKWLDSILGVMAKESEENTNLLSNWANEYISKAVVALTPLSDFSENKEILANNVNNLKNRLSKIGLKV